MSPIWIDPEEVKVPDELRKAIGGHPLIAETLVRRGYDEPQKAQAYLSPEAYLPTPANEIPGISKATMRINRAIDQGETILVWGDFDVDGQTSTTLLISPF